MCILALYMHVPWLHEIHIPNGCSYICLMIPFVAVGLEHKMYHCLIETVWYFLVIVLLP